MTVAMLIDLLRKRRHLRRRERWPRARLMAYQDVQLIALRAHAIARSPFYRHFHAGLAGRPLSELPILTKAMLMESFDELVVDREVRLADVEAHLATTQGEQRFRDRYWVAATSGSTGRRGIFLSDHDEWTTVLASYARANDWAGVKAGLLRTMKIAVVSSRTPWHQSALVGATLKSRWVDALRLDATEPVPEIVTRLNQFQPQSLTAYARMARVLADEQLAGRLRIAPQAVMCASEVLTEETRTRIQRAWGKPPFNVYAATEPAGIASDCERHAMHLYEDLVITEVVDEQHRPVPVGQYGAKVLVTVLFSRTQPLIRYEMSDSVCVSSLVCGCGRPFAVLAGVQGREEDFLRLAGVAGSPVTIHPNVFHNIFEAAPVRGWQRVQEAKGLRLLVVGAAADLDEAGLAAKVSAALAGQGAIATDFRIERTADIPRSKLGKTSLIKALRVDADAPARAAAKG